MQARFAKTPASIGIDLFFGGGTPPFRALSRAGLLVPRALSRSALEGIPETLGGTRLTAGDEGWYGTALSGFGILYNKALLRDKGLPEPVSWTDLAHPRAAGNVASVDPRASGSAHVIYEIILQRHGWDKGWRILCGIAANSGHFTKGASAVLPLISSGEAAYTVAIDQYAWSLIEKLGTDRVGFRLPPGETVTTPDPIAMLKGAPHADIAARFMEFVLSEPCQRLWTLKAGVPGGPRSQSLNRMSVRPAVAARLDTAVSFIRGNPFTDAEGMAWSYSDSLTEARWSLVNDALGLWMVDSHADAARAYAALASAHPPARDSAAWEAAVAAHPLFAPPTDNATALAFAARWKDDSFRNATVAEWAGRLAKAGKERHD